ncbi:hypothetical protein SAMN05216327_10239 [Dyadobacter sp. SG02]|uniref:hypothetical protein n=1 Tax=Dyadobacter sp. SG02 TaxID=1855291 RepID=UPI0008BF1DF3|nr:hypothetical protein [Dyadobacter sp. SG02]SEI49744.1 hypothetical protein SAMN05216327_10239 [Dyadobacter sp. SG02]
MFKTITISVTLFLTAFVCFAQETITNPSVISMTKAKISKDVILDKIKFGPTKFNMSTPGLIELKKEGVHESVVDAMMLASSPMPMIRNQDVIDMHIGGVSRTIITKKIQYSDTDFSLTTEALINLKAAKVPDALVKVMMVPKRAQQQSTNPNLIAGTLPPHPENFPVPARGKFSEPGIYYEEFKKGAPQYEQLEPTTTNQTRKGTVGEAFLNQATSGVSGTTQRVGLANPSANFVIEDNKPVFYMVFSGANRKNMNEVAESIFEGVASPNDFTLLRVKPSNRGREFVVGRESAYTSETGFGEGAIPFRFKKISNTLYKIYFDQEISAAEYAFFYNKGSEFTSSIKLYDFSLHNNVK